MNKKLLIVSNNCPWQSWPEKVAGLKRWFAPKIELDVVIVHTQFQNVPFSVYDSATGALGVDQNWLFKNVSYLGKGYDLLLFVLPKSQWQRPDKARGWRTFDPYGAVDLQLGADEYEPFWKRFLGLDGEMFHQVARHEIMHGLFYQKCGKDVRFDLPPQEGQCLDTTHYYFDRDQLENALEDLIPAVEKPIYIIHHTGTSRDKTNLQAIINDHMIRYGRPFYQCFITADGNVHWQHQLTNQRKGAVSIDYCVVGDFNREKPTEAQLDALSRIVGKNSYLPHGGAVKYGATASECPGTLLADLEAYRLQLKSLQKQIDVLVEMIKKIFGLKPN
jgi:hypothetical protein